MTIRICLHVYIEESLELRLLGFVYICDRLQENRAQRGVRKYQEKIDRFLKNVLFQADGRERLGLL